jgi:hypothetical protein
LRVGIDVHLDLAREGVDALEEVGLDAGEHGDRSLTEERRLHKGMSCG